MIFLSLSAYGIIRLLCSRSIYLLQLRSHILLKNVIIHAIHPSVLGHIDVPFSHFHFHVTLTSTSSSILEPSRSSTLALATFPVGRRRGEASLALPFLSSLASLASLATPSGILPRCLHHLETEKINGWTTNFNTLNVIHVLRYKYQLLQDIKKP